MLSSQKPWAHHNYEYCTTDSECRRRFNRYTILNCTRKLKSHLQSDLAKFSQWKLNFYSSMTELIFFCQIPRIRRAHFSSYVKTKKKLINCVGIWPMMYTDSCAYNHNELNVLKIVLVCKTEIFLSQKKFFFCSFAQMKERSEIYD